MSWSRGWLAVAIVAWSAAPVMAHSAEEPTPVEVHILQDEGEDAFYWYDGYDLYNLFIREAYWEPLDQAGVILRFTLYGGFSQAPAASALHIDIGLEGPAGLQVIRMSTADDQAWSGDGIVVGQDTVEDAPPFTGVTSKLQVFVSYAALGLDEQALGDANLHGIWMASYADDDLLDRAPGGYFSPGPGDGAEIPAESERLVDSLPLRGPIGYLTTEPTAGRDAVRVRVANPFPENGQHASVRFDEQAGWLAEAVTPLAASLDPGEETTFEMGLRAEPEAVAPFRFDVVSDLGGRETFHVGATMDALDVQSTDRPVLVEPAPLQETPAWEFLGLALAGWVATRAAPRA